MIHRFCVWAFALFFALDPTVQAAKDKEELPTPPPMAMAHNEATYRGRSVEINLRAIGRAPGQLRFLIRKQPRYGKLGEITIVDRKNAVVTYTHDERNGAGTDTFTFAVQAQDSPVSAAGVISIAVSEEPAAFSVVHALDFGQVTLGETREDEIVLRNSGGNVVSGKIIAPAPWKVLGSDTYQLGRHQEQKARILFAPSEDEAYVEKLLFSHDARTSVTLTGKGFAPLAFEPGKEIELIAEKGTSLRKHEVLIRNLTDRPRIVEIETPPNIVELKDFAIPPQGEMNLLLSSKPDFIEAIDGMLMVSSEGFRKEIPLRAYALAPALQAEPSTGFNFGDVQVGRRYKEVLRLKNTGGVEAKITCDLPSGVLLTPDPNSVVIAPGETRAFELAFEPSVTGEIKLEPVLNVTRGEPVRLAIQAQGVAVNNGQASVPAAPGKPAKVAEPRMVAEEKVPEGSMPAISNIKVLKSVPHEVELAWTKPAANALGTVIEFRQLEATADGPPKIKWTEWRGAKFFEENGMTVARFENLPPGRVWYIRIFSVDELGRKSVPSPTILLTSEKLPDRRLGWWLAGLLIAGLIALLIRHLKRGRAQAADEDADRISRLEKS